MSVTREQVVKVLVERDWREPFTTADIAAALTVDEYPVRAAVSWLCVAEVLRAVGTTRRLDRFNRWYGACLYLWEGKTEIPRVRRNRDEREASRPVSFDLGCFNLLMEAVCTKK